MTSKLGIPESEALRLLYYMKLARAFEDRIRSLYLQGKIIGGVYTGRGNEATSVGTAAALEEGDFIAPLHRDIGAHFVRGMLPSRIAAQYLGRRAAPSAGKDGNVHAGDVDLGIAPMISHLGVSIPQAAGAALAFRIRKQARVAMTYVGDGATSIGDFHEGLNFAAVLQLPLIVTIENNQFAYSTPTSKQFRGALVKRADGYGIAGAELDGTDCIAVYLAARKAVERARSGGGPTLLVSNTMRMRGHSEHDDASYVPKGMLEEWARKDPITLMETRLRQAGAADTALTEIDARVAKEVDEALEWATVQPLPEGREVLEGVYAAPGEWVPVRHDEHAHRPALHA